jgi:ribosomal protein L32E
MGKYATLKMKGKLKNCKKYKKKFKRSFSLKYLKILDHSSNCYSSTSIIYLGYSRHWRRITKGYETECKIDGVMYKHICTVFRKSGGIVEDSMSSSHKN